jgi:HAD superfamily hydrolase (TIGR01509 family)
MNVLPGAALLFDIDGTLVDTDRLHLQAFNDVFGPLGHRFDAARFKAELQGFSIASIIAHFLSAETEARGRAIMEEKEAAFRRLAQAGLEPLPGLMALLDRIDAAGLPIAAVTNAPRANADLLLNALGIRQRFRAIILGDELEHGKPHPLPYLEGLRALGARPELSVAFEDSASGVTSASAAGITTVGITTSLTDRELRAVGASSTVRDYQDPMLFELIARVVTGQPAI